jgi:hypothetical protein
VTDPMADLEPEWLEIANTEEARAIAELPEPNLPAQREVEHRETAKRYLAEARARLADMNDPTHRNPAYGGKQ